MPLIDDVSDDETLAEFVPNWDQKRWDVSAAVMLSACAASDQMNFVYEIQKHMKIHFFGECSNDPEVKMRYVVCICLALQRSNIFNI